MLLSNKRFNEGVKMEREEGERQVGSRATDPPGLQIIRSLPPYWLITIAVLGIVNATTMWIGLSNITSKVEVMISDQKDYGKQQSAISMKLVEMDMTIKDHERRIQANERQVKP